MTNWKDDVLKILKSRQVVKGALVLAALVGLRLGLNWWDGRAIKAAVPVVKVEKPTSRSLDPTLGLPGNVEALEQATLYAHVSGYLKNIKVDEGDKVKKGQLLAVIDAPDILQEYRNAKAEYDFKEITRKRYESLLNEKVVSQQEYDKIQAEANQAKARFDNAAANQEYTMVRAPFKGAIARRFKYPGDFISAPTKGGTPSALFLLVNEEALRVSINVPQKEVSSVAVGRDADIKVDTFPGEVFHGKISRVDALLDDSTKTQRVLIDVDNDDTRLHAGMFASVTLHLGHKDNVPMIPKDALHQDGDKNFVWVVQDGKVKKTLVSPGQGDGNYIEVAGVSSSDVVVVTGSHALVDGAAVQVAAENTRAPQKESDDASSTYPRKIAEEAKK